MGTVKRIRKMQCCNCLKMQSHSFGTMINGCKYCGNANLMETEKPLTREQMNEENNWYDDMMQQHYAMIREEALEKCTHKNDACGLLFDCLTCKFNDVT